MIDRLKFIQNIIDTNNYKSYLEIGVYKGDVFNNIKGVSKTGVDPDTSNYSGEYLDNIYNMHSDIFFESTLKRKYDCIFIDGLHLREQVIKDVENSLDCLNEGGIIILHDTNPIGEKMCTRKRLLQGWCGDVYKAVIHFRMREDLITETHDIETGITTIRVGENPDPIGYDFLNNYRYYLLNIK